MKHDLYEEHPSLGPALFFAEPVLEALDENYSIVAKRGQMRDWVFSLYESDYLTTISQAPQDKMKRFRLEIIR